MSLFWKFQIKKKKRTSLILKLEKLKKIKIIISENIRKFDMTFIKKKKTPLLPLQVIEILL